MCFSVKLRHSPITKWMSYLETPVRYTTCKKYTDKCKAVFLTFTVLESANKSNSVQRTDFISFYKLIIEVLYAISRYELIYFEGF